MTEDLTWAVGALAEVSTTEFDVDELLHRLCEVAARSLRVDGVGVMKAVDGRTVFVHVSDPALLELEQLQQVLQQGPCKDAIDTHAMVSAASLAEMRWPEFRQVAAATRVHAVLAVPLISRGAVWGTVDLYWRRDHLVTDADRAAAQLLANVAVSYLAMAQDRDRARQAQQQLARQVMHDQLTGLPNRGLMQELIGHALAAADRRNTVVAVLFVDLDRFKAINDTFGHHAGDQLLQVVAQRMQQALRAGDTVGRVSGDEFLILCEDIADHTDGEHDLTMLGNRIRRAVAQPIPVNDTTVRVNASIGVAFTAERPTAAELIHSADIAMYEAKTAGRDQVVLHRHADSGAPDRRNLQQQLFHALNDGELRVHYQPIVTPTGAITGVEALIRWQHPTLGLLAAADFIDLAETSGVIIPIGMWLIRQALNQLNMWAAERPHTAPQLVFCNFSPQQLLAPALPHFLTDTLKEFGLSPAQVGVEILEADLADPRLIDVLTALQRAGHPVVVDDFGTGYSSLSRLIDLPVAYVKIDRSLGTELPDDPRSRAMIKAVHALAADLGFTVISEGVETAPQAHYLHNAGTDLLQGFYYGHPMTAEDLTAAMRR